MTFDLQKMLESKRTYGARLAAAPIGQKLRLLDALRERELAIRTSARQSPVAIVRDDPESSPHQ